MPKFLEQFLTNQRVEVPVEQEFPSTGFIGKVSAAMLWRLSTGLDLQGPEFRDDVPAPYAREQRRDGTYDYYYVDQTAAAAAAKMDDEAFTPQMVWMYSMPVASVLNVDTSKFTAQTINRSCRVTTLRSKYRHEFHMIALPAIVAAAARVNGYDVPVIDFGPLAVNNAIISDAVSENLIGTGKEYADSVLWQQRAALWAALGEPDPRKYLMGAKDQHGNLHKDSTEATKLLDCLALYHYMWSGPIWGRVVMIADPRPEAVAKSGNRLTLPAMTEIFTDQAEAEKAKEEDLKKQAKPESKPESKPGPNLPVSDDDMPPAPAGWEDAVGSWLEVVAPFAAMPKVKAEKTYKADDYGVSFEELWKWAEYLKAM
jgi:hypothetical protein